MEKHLKSSGQVIDRESESCLKQMVGPSEVLSNRIPSVKIVLVVLSARGIVFDRDALRQQILLAYPEAAVFFQATVGKAIGQAAPEQVDLTIDFTGPRQRQGLFYAKKLRRQARFIVGRNAGLFRKRIYDRLFDEKANAAEVPTEMLACERFVQKRVLELAGVAFLQAGEALPDRGKSIALELPGMQRL